MEHKDNLQRRESDGKNYRGISLLSTCEKIFTRARQKRQERFMDKILGEYQGGFRSGRSTTDKIVTVRI